MSTKLGTLCIIIVPGQSIEPAINTRAEFLAPLILTFPFKGALPQISSTAWGSSVTVLVGVKSEIELMAFSS